MVRLLTCATSASLEGTHSGDMWCVNNHASAQMGKQFTCTCSLTRHSALSLDSSHELQTAAPLVQLVCARAIHPHRYRRGGGGKHVPVMNAVVYVLFLPLPLPLCNRFIAHPVTTTTPTAGTCASYTEHVCKRRDCAVPNCSGAGGALPAQQGEGLNVQE